MPELGNLPYGGLALLEGVMMRSPRYFAVACRAPNGKIVVHTEELEKTWIGRQKWLRLPFLRGSLAILDSMALGIRAMRFAGDVQMEEKYQAPGEESATSDSVVESEAAAAAATLAQGQPAVTAAASGDANKNLQSIYIAGAMIAGLALGTLIFNVLPQFIAQLTGVKAGDQKGTATNYIAEFVKIFIFVGYIWLISRMKPVQEMFKYHGAEHKAINNLEAGTPLSVDNTRGLTRLHPRCGTSFMVIVFLIGLLILPLVPRYPIYGHPTNFMLDLLVRIAIEVLLVVPIIAGVSYELLRIAGKFRNQQWVELAFAPGLASQKYLTTVEPNDGQIEVALASLSAVVKAEQQGVLTNSDDYDAEPITNLEPVVEKAS